jgi:hypothetical protein
MARKLRVEYGALMMRRNAWGVTLFCVSIRENSCHSCLYPFSAHASTSPRFFFAYFRALSRANSGLCYLCSLL